MAAENQKCRGVAGLSRREGWPLPGVVARRVT
jgi:hypothetical protein